MSHDPLFLTTAVEAVVRAGDVMLERFGTAVRVDMKGAITWSPRSTLPSNASSAR